MKVTIVEPFGFCAGVELAMKKAFDLAKNNQKVSILGMLVHNNDAIKQLNEANIKTVYNPNKSLLELIDYLEKDTIVVLTAHGHEKSVEDKLEKLGYKFIDATCPKVMLAEKTVHKVLQENHEIIFIGKKNHPEANAILSLSNKIYLFEKEVEFNYSQIKDKKPVIISQTTFSIDEIKDLVKNIRQVFKDAIFIDNVCNASKERQDAVHNISEDIDTILVVGGINSNNTKTLYELAKSEKKKATVYKIENVDSLNSIDTSKMQNVAIVSGASTPKSILFEIKDCLLKK